MSLIDNKGKFITRRVDDYAKRKGWFFGSFAVVENVRACENTELIVIRAPSVNDKKIIT